MRAQYFLLDYTKKLMVKGDLYRSDIQPLDRHVLTIVNALCIHMELSCASDRNLKAINSRTKYLEQSCNQHKMCASA